MKYKSFMQLWNGLSDRKKVELFNDNYAGDEACLFLKQDVIKELFSISEGGGNGLFDGRDVLGDFLKMWDNSFGKHDVKHKFYLVDLYYETIITFDEFEQEFFDQMEIMFEDDPEFYFGSYV